MQRLALIINGNKKSSLAVSAKHQFDSDSQLYVKVLTTEYNGHAIELATAAINKYNCTYIIAVGGDGTVNEVVNGIFKACRLPNTIEKEEGNKLPSYQYNTQKLENIYLGVYAAGTGNDFIKTAHLKTSWSAIHKAIKTQQYTTIDVGTATFTHANNNQIQRFFLNITDIGMGGQIAQQLAKQKSRWLSPEMFYAKAIVSTFFTYKKADILCQAPNVQWTGDAMSVVIANGKYFGSGMGIAPNAEINDGKLSLVVLGDINLWDYISQIGNIKKCQVLKHPQAFYYQVEEVQLKAKNNKPLPIDMDGEFVGYTPLYIKVVHKALNLLLSV